MTSSSKTMALVELPLGQPGMAYVSRCLENETSFLQDVRRLSFHGGSVFGVVPEGTDLKRAVDFEPSLDIGMKGPNDWLTNRMIARCRANPQSVIVFDEPWGGRRNSPEVARRTAPKFFHRNFVYHFVAADQASAPTIDAAMRAGGGFLFIAAFVDYPFTADQIDAEGAIDDRLMQTLAANVREIYVSAYDHDSYVVWQR
ncbi:MAG: hypothetical protein KGJ66_09400 [Alphaproteobacteria bacterium]|nr:hypothetical protein [Alphaproteobacteria bacterium]